MNKLTALFFMSLLFVAVFYFFVVKANKQRAEENYRQYCGSCHLAPNPEHLTRKIWREKVLPDMGARLGMKTDGFDPVQNHSFEEQHILIKHKIYPRQPHLSKKDWAGLKAYILEKAPEKPDTGKNRNTRNSILSQFNPAPISLDEKPGAFVTYLRYDKKNRELNIGDVYGNIYKTNNGISFSKLASITSPVVSVIERDSFSLITGMGHMPPTELKSGKIYRSEKNGVMQLIQDTLHRPVFVEMQDLDENGVEEIIVCEYGNQIGQLTLLRRKNDKSRFQPEVLLPLPGAVRVIVEDMNNDGKKDLVALHAQGDEGINILYQEDDLKFRFEKVIRLSPLYGSSWFELFDYDGDGDKDIALANGDNADLSFMLKPYHGLRIFINDGNNGFAQQYFYPIYGATRVAAHDFDVDGDVDFAVCAFFPDYHENPEEAFVYLENIDAVNFSFKAYALDEATLGRWMVMEQGDFDSDGDTDLMLGSFIHSPAPTPQQFRDEWEKQNTDLMFLENQLKKDLPRIF